MEQIAGRERVGLSRLVLAGGFFRGVDFFFDAAVLLCGFVRGQGFAVLGDSARDLVTVDEEDVVLFDAGLFLPTLAVGFGALGAKAAVVLFALVPCGIGGGDRAVAQGVGRRKRVVCGTVLGGRDERRGKQKKAGETPRMEHTGMRSAGARLGWHGVHSIAYARIVQKVPQECPVYWVALMKIVLAEKVSPATLAVFQQEPSWAVVTPDQIKNGLEAELADADALVVRSAVQVTAELLEHAPKLRVIGRAGVGVDNIDAPAATHRGIVVMNTPGANAVAVAELTLGLMITMARGIPRANATMHAGKWEKKSLQGTELRGKTLGIVGLGRIGLEVARRARAFGMELLAFDPFVAPVIARENGVTLVSIDQIFSQSDYLTLHVGLTPQTEGFINQHSIGIMKPGIRIMNCARGELINDAALVEGLKSGKVGGAALDVFTVEPLKDSAYYGVENVILTPHLGGSTDEAQEAIGIQLAQQVSAYLKSGVVQNAVNVPSLTREEYVEVAPFVDLAERLGPFCRTRRRATWRTWRLPTRGGWQRARPS